MGNEKNIYASIIKPIGDLLISIILMILLSPVFLIITALVALKDGFPVIFKQQRAGRKGECFQVFKFRTMVKNADKLGGTSTMKGDPRITKIGKFLRKTSLDELPQLMNIIKGDMSLVGFRPGIYRSERDYGALKYKYKPGITGMAQVNGRSELLADEKDYWENFYAENISFKLDVKIMIKTVAVVFFSKGTN